MPKKIQNTTKAHLVSVPLPNHAASYTVISHQFIIDYAYQSLAAAGFGIVSSALPPAASHERESKAGNTGKFW